ncbi:MAG: prepilin-type N-terminal cleavage/methylation domain-containing protein [Solirubrobacterales bacterium]
MSAVSDEHGYTLIELLVGVMLSLLVLGAILTVVQVAVTNQDRTAERVAANQRGRPVMTRIIDRLHSACVAPKMTPVRAGSDDDSLIVLSKAGSAAVLSPDRYVIGLEGGALTEAVYPYASGEAPEWTFAQTPGASTVLVDGIGAAAVGEPPQAVPLFRYYAYEDVDKDGKIETVPLGTPLSEETAARTVRVDVAFSVAPPSGTVKDPEGAIALTDSATLRIEPASEDSAQVNLPCV